MGNVLLLLLKAWFLATGTERGRQVRFPYTYDRQGVEVRGNSVEFCLFSLAENFATRGGCAPGFAGRVVRDLLILLRVQAGDGDA